MNFLLEAESNADLGAVHVAPKKTIVRIKNKCFNFIFLMSLIRQSLLFPSNKDIDVS